jgi:hypothetical protein
MNCKENYMAEVARVRSKWKVIGFVWFLIISIGWMPVVYPTYSTVILKGIIFAGITISTVAIFFWPKKEWAVRLIMGQLIAVELLVFSVRSAFLLPKGLAYLFLGFTILGYVCIFLLPTYLPKLASTIAAGSPETRLGKKMIRAAIGSLGAAGACGASIGIFGGRLYGFDILGILSPLSAAIGIALGFLSFHHLWQQRPWLSKQR